jgi:hypothetical protein
LRLSFSNKSGDGRVSRWIPKLDTVAITLSGLCAIHCAALPLLMLALPFVGSHEFEETLRWSLGCVGVLIVGLGVWSHRNMRAILPLVLALALFVACGVEGAHGPLEIVLSLAASACLITAHWLNTAACRAHASGSHASKLKSGVVVSGRTHQCCD